MMKGLLALLALTTTPLYACAPGSGDELRFICDTLTPAGLFHHFALPQPTPLPFHVTFDPPEVTDTQLVHVTISSPEGRHFLGFMAQARAGEATSPLGIFYPEDIQMQSITCTSLQDTAFQSNFYPKTNVTFSWDPPSGFHGKVKMYVSVVETPALFWAKYLAGAVTVN